VFQDFQLLTDRTVDKNLEFVLTATGWIDKEQIYSRIESVLQQEFTNWELLIINDGSTDNSANICDRYTQQDIRIHVLHQKNAGVSAARRKGVEMAAGKYICFVDGDDTLPMDALKKLYDNIREYDMVIGQTKYLYQKSTKIQRIHSHVYSKIDYVKALLTMEINIAPFSRLIKRDLFDSDSLDIPKAVLAGSDFIMNVRLGVKVKNCNVIDAVVYNYNVGRQGSIINSSRNTMESTKLRTKLLLQPIEDAGLSRICKNEITWLKAINILALINTYYAINCNDDFVKKTIVEIQQLKWNIKNSRIKLYFLLLKTPFLNKNTIKFLQFCQKTIHHFPRKFLRKKEYGII
jgi:glycosyltransferase involved in cell wall biosynthesis